MLYPLIRKALSFCLLISLRAGRKSIISTTNISFEWRDEISIDSVMTGAMIDRLTNKPYMINMNDNSFYP